MDFCSCVILQVNSRGTTIRRFDEVHEIDVVSKEIFLLNTHVIDLYTRDGTLMEIGPIIIPDGLVARLAKATHASKVFYDGLPLVSKEKCLPPADVGLETLLLEVAKLHKQTSTFWEKEDWVPKEKKATAYYRLEHGVLWAIRYIKKEHEEGEWIMEKIGDSISSLDWDKLRKNVQGL